MAIAASDTDPVSAVPLTMESVAMVHERSTAPLARYDWKAKVT